MTLEEVLKEKVPLDAVDYCVRLWDETPFHFKVSRTRSTCLGNYRFFKNQHYISVNHDLNPYNFLITYVHEVAHLRVQLKKGRFRKYKPHGAEWKSEFQNLMAPILKPHVFPSLLYKVLEKHMRNPKASSTRDPNLLVALRAFDENPAFTLSQVDDEAYFKFKNNVFQKIKNRRTRALVKNPDTQATYTLSLQAVVELLPPTNYN